jgi:hypothetical protein
MTRDRLCDSRARTFQVNTLSRALGLRAVVRL